MVIKKKILKQKGGTPNVLIRYFDNIFVLLEKYNNLFESYKQFIHTSKNLSKNNDNIAELLEKLQSNYIYKINLFKELSIILLKILRDNLLTNESRMINSISSILNSLFLNMGENKNDFISKLLKIYRHILFIDYLYNTKNRYSNSIFKNQKIFIKSLTLLKLHSRPVNEINQLLRNHNNSTNKKINPLIQKIRKMFLEEYPFDIPIFYGNMIDSQLDYNLDYNQFICKKVGASSNEKRNYIINPVGGLIHLLIMLIKNDKINRSPTTSDYNERLHKLLSKILMIDDINRLFPKIKYLPFGTIFCIVKEQNGEEVIHGEDLSKCSRIHGCELRMTAEIRKKNIVSNEDILEFLDIFLCIYFENESIIIPPNMNANVNVRQHLTLNQPKIQEQQIEHIEHRRQNVNKRTHNKYFEGIIELLYNLKNLKNKITQMQKLKNKNGITNSRIIQEQNNARNRIISIFINNILQLPESNIPELQKLQNDVKSSISQSNRNLLQSFTSEIINKILDLIILNPKIKKEFDYFLEKNHMKKMKINSIYQP
jgi:hypothetical protein